MNRFNRIVKLYDLDESNRNNWDENTVPFHRDRNESKPNEAEWDK